MGRVAEPTVPSASDGTVTALVADGIDRVLRADTPSARTDSGLGVLLSSLTGTSLPTSFAGLLPSLLQRRRDDEGLRTVCARLLVDQATAPRRAASDRREFIHAAKLLARLEPGEFFGRFGRGGGGGAEEAFMGEVGRLAV